MSNQSLSQFTNIYSLQKSLRFELRPVNETANYIEEFHDRALSDIVDEDKQRAEDYQAVKVILDEYHQLFIEKSLVSLPAYVTPEAILEAFSLYQNIQKSSAEHKNENIKKWQEYQKKLRELVAKCFQESNKEAYGRLFKKELFKVDLPNWLTQENREQDLLLVQKFARFTTYFKGFNENRQNIYTKEEHSTGIAYRLIHENMVKFFDNCIRFQSLRKNFPEFSLGAVLTDFTQYIPTIFEPPYFLKCVTQSEIEHYNLILGGASNEKGQKTQGVNEKINLFKQHQSKEDARKINRMTPLFKQILSDRESYSFIPKQFESDTELLTALQQLQSKSSVEFKNLQNTLITLKGADHSKIFLRKSELNTLSHQLWSTYSIFETALSLYQETLTTKKLKTEFEKRDVYSLAELSNCLQTLSPEMQPTIKKQELEEYFSSQETLEALFHKDTLTTYQALEPILYAKKLSRNRKAPQETDAQGETGFEQITIIKKYLDSLMSALHFSKPLFLFKNRTAIIGLDKDESFYQIFDQIYLELESLIIPFYNKTRNYLTRKPYTTDKVKINFSNNTLLSGWDLNKETANAGVLLKKDGLFYLAIMKKGHTNLFDYIESEDDSNKKIEKKRILAQHVLASPQESCYEKMCYKLIPGANTMLPKVFFSNRRIQDYQPNAEILRIRNTGSHTKSGQPQSGFEKAPFNLADCHTIIDFFKQSLEKHPEWRHFGFHFSDTSTYKDTSDFFTEVEQQGYHISFERIQANYIEEQVKKGTLFLFQIYSKDFSEYSKGRPNLHTLYWKALFEEKNLRDVVIKLNGEAEIFFRRHSIPKNERTVHRAREKIPNKNPNNSKETSDFSYDLIKDRRYTQDKFFLHVPLTLNFKARGANKFNTQVNRFLKDNPEVNIIGIDRGERHLLYVTVINQQGHILYQQTLNQIKNSSEKNGNSHTNDYREKLDVLEKKRDVARRSWSAIENIKELKEGYLSHVVHLLAKLITEYNAIVCLEDLNKEFKRGRFKVEKQVYQKFEKVLIEKLNYLVFKDKKHGETGHYLKAYQLTSAFKSFKDLGKQSGVLFYVPADYTSKIDPTTGYVDHLRVKYESIEKAKTLLKKFNSFRYNPILGYFEFEIDYKKLLPNTKVGRKTQWKLCTLEETASNSRVESKRIDKQWQTVKVNVTSELKRLFDSTQGLEFPITYQDGQDILSNILQQDKVDFFKGLMRLIGLTMSLRHSLSDHSNDQTLYKNDATDKSKEDAEKDYILSPVMNKDGVFFDSRKANSKLPQNSDANGAYHIALKGLMNLRSIGLAENIDRISLKHDREDWFNFMHEFTQ